MASWDWKRLARAWERVGRLLTLEEMEADEFGVVSLHLLESRDFCVESDGSWAVLLDEECEIVLVVFSDIGSVSILTGAAFCFWVGVVLSLWTRARRGDGGDGNLARPGIFGLKVALVGKLFGYIMLFCGCTLV